MGLDTGVNELSKNSSAGPSERPRDKGDPNVGKDGARTLSLNAVRFPAGRDE